MSESTENAASNPVRRRPSAAGKLLAAISNKGSPPLDEIARHLRTSVRLLEACRDGLETLELELQAQLAEIVLSLAPEHRRQAHTLYNQAQAALTMQREPDRCHQVYPRQRFR